MESSPTPAVNWNIGVKNDIDWGWISVVECLLRIYQCEAEAWLDGRALIQACTRPWVLFSSPPPVKPAGALGTQVQGCLKILTLDLQNLVAGPADLGSSLSPFCPNFKGMECCSLSAWCEGFSLFHSRTLVTDFQALSRTSTLEVYLIFSVIWVFILLEADSPNWV